MLTPFKLRKTPSRSFDSPWSIRRNFPPIGSDIFLKTPDSTVSRESYSSIASEKVRAIRAATLGLYDATIVAQVDKVFHDPKKPVADANPYIVPTMISDALMRAATTLGNSVRALGVSLDSQVNVASYVAAVELIMAFDFMNSAALDRSKPFACHRISLIRLAKKGRVSLDRSSGTMKFASWLVDNPRESVVDVGYDAQEDFSTPDFSGLSRNSISLGYFDLTAIDLFENFKWLSGGKVDWAKTFVKANGAWFGHCSFSLQYLHSLVRDIRVTVDNQGLWRPKIMPKDWTSPGRFAAVPIRNLPEAKIWFDSIKLLESNLTLTAYSRDERTLLGGLQSAVRPLSGMITVTDVLRGLPAMTVSDCIELNQRIDFDTFLHQALVTEWRKGSSDIEYEPNNTTAYSRAIAGSLDLAITSALSNILTTRRGKRQLPFGSFVRTTGQSIFVDFKKNF